ncbi:hypothetical protein ABD91_25785 [Lysinibacillus sphaericus]|uniref:hypothetical protein n=1 Tax=Lysinibacillus sphaericus TaxID=1421 RepID=UPI0018CFDA89|nr:hypothetical protein [Lysinibacillus sphaericus]MBG9694150.1 hypothetical protein [Lysinibacillus sphaericus]
MLGVKKREVLVSFSEYHGNGGFKTEDLTQGVSVRIRKDMVERLMEPIKFSHKIDGKTVCEVMIKFVIVKGETISELRNICVENNRSKKYLPYGEEIAKDVQNYLNNELIESVCVKQQAFEEAFQSELSKVLVGVKNDTDFVVKVSYDVEFEQTFETLNRFDSGKMSKLYLTNGVLYCEINKAALMKELYAYQFLQRDGVIIVNGDKCFMEKYQA